MILPRELKDLYSSSLIKPIGSQNPKFYLLVDPVQSYSISPISDQYFQSIIRYLVKSNLIIDDLDFLSKFRISSCVPFAPQELCEDSSWKKRDRQSSDEDLMNFKDYVLEDINKSNPEVIIVCGSNATKLISDFKFNSSEEGQEYSSNLLFKYNEIPVIFCKSIREIFKSNSDTFLRKELASFTGKIIQAINLSKNINTLQTNTKWETLDVFDINELSRLTEIFKDDIKLVLDYETSGLNTNLKGFHLGVVGLCNLDCTKSVILYFSDLFRSGTENKPPKDSLEFLNSFFSTKKFVVFNRMFECAVTNSPAVGINFNLKECEDVLMWLRCLAESSSLKDAASSRLGINKWNDSTEEWIECINHIVKNLKPTASMKGQREEIQWMIDNCTGLFEIKDYFKLDFDKEVIKELKKVIKDSASKIKELELTEDQLNRIKEFTELNKIRLNSTKEHQSLIKEFKELAISDYFEFNKGKEIFLSKKDNSFLDTLKTLKKICHKFFKEDEFDGINLELKNYVIELLQNHHSFESASYADIPLAIISPYCIADCNYTAKLYHLIKLELEEKNLIKAAEVYNRQAYLGYVLVRNGIAWDDKLASDLKIEYQNTQLESLRSLITLPAMLKVLDLDPKTILTVRSTTDLDLLKSIFNPMSSYKYTEENEHKSTSIRMSKVLGTPRFKLASLLYDVYLYSKEIEDVNECLKEFPTLYPIFKEIISLESTTSKLEFLDSLLLNVKEKVSDLMIENQANYFKKYKKSPQEIQERLKYKGWKLESISHEYTEGLYRIFETIMGRDPNNDKDWPEEFWALYYFKLVKKTDKSIGTYLEGSIGRDSVEIVKKSEIQKECALRLAKYYDREKNEDEVYINRSSFGVCSVSTKRWQSAQHTVPKATELMDLRCSRYDDGIKLHFDYCLHKDTTVVLGDGTSKSLLEMYNGSKNGINYTCISKNTKTKKLEEKKVVEVIRNSYRESLLEIELEDGLIVKCTPEHKFYLKNGEIKEAKDLTTEDELDNFSNKIKCEFCFKDFKELQWQHLNSHNIKISEYRESNRLASEYTSYTRGRYRKDNPLPEYHLAKMEEGRRIKGPMSSEEWNRRSLSGKRRYVDPTERKRQSELTKLQWRNPEISAKMREGISIRSSTQQNRYSYGKSGKLETKKAGLIHYRSSYEEKYYAKLDLAEEVISFKVEPFVIKCEVGENKIRRYLPDVLVFYKDKTIELIEIKPEFKKQEFINSYKYLPTLELCKNKGYLFKIVTEKDIL